MKNVRVLLLPVMVIAGSLCATSQKERIEELARIFHYAAKNCHQLSNPYLVRDLVRDDIA